jgi:cell wall-associated NlpC family hydrolase
MPDYRGVARAAAIKYGLDPNIFERQIGQESGFNPHAKSGAGALGIAQFMPATARGMGINPNDPVAALYGAARMDAGNLKKYGSYERMLSAYNSGRADAYTDPNFAHGETYNYVKSIMGRAKIPAGSIPLTGKGVDTPSSMASRIPGDPGRQALVSGLLTSLSTFSRTGKVDTNALSGALSQLQELRGGARATFVADGNAGPVRDPAGMISEAKRWLGTPYSWGGGGTSGPTRGTGRGAKTVGFDCSSFIQYLWAKRGVNIPRTTYAQFKAGHPVPMNQLQPGDAVYFDPTPQGPGHVGMYIGHGQYIQAPRTGDVVRISNLNGAGTIGARRFSA